MPTPRIAAASPTLLRASSGEQIAKWLRAEIVTGALRRGDRVTQEDVAKELGVSRIPVREALVALEREGWVTIEHHRGAFVQGLDETWVRDHYEILGVLYGLASARAALRGSDEDRSRLRLLHRGATTANDLDSFDAANHALLQHLLTMARSPRLVTAMRAIASLVPGNFFAQVPNTMNAQRRALAPIVRAVLRGDAEASRRAMEALLARQGEEVVALLHRRAVLVEVEQRAAP